MYIKSINTALLKAFEVVFPISFVIFACGYSASADSFIGGEVVQTLASHIPHGLRALSDYGKTAEDQEVTVTVSLSLNNQDELNGLIKRLYDPRDPAFHHFLTSEEFRNRFSPTEQQVESVKNFLLEHGVLPLSSSENRMLIRAKGTIGAFNSLFHTEVHQFRDAKGQTYFAPAYELHVPAGVPILGVHGLQNFTHYKRHSFRMTNTAKASLEGSGPGGGLSPSDIHKAYNIPTNLDGTGQALAIFELDGFTASDITGYESQFGLKAIPVNTVLVGQATGTPGQGAPEVTLDIELMLAVAPNVSQILVYEGTNDEQGLLATYSQIANDNKAHQISTSWGLSEDNNTSATAQSENNIFKQMVAQGQALYAAAGDSGAYDDGSNLSVDDPASQPYVVGVGGTSLTIASGGTYVSETTWNTDNSPGDGGGGGGVSTVWSIPDWQQGAVTPQSLGSATKRNVPDVSLDADPNTGYAIYFGGAWNIYGGTSCGAPIWAAFHALVNQQRQSQGLSSLGFPNPAFYQIGKSSRYSSDFYDIKDNSTNMYYPAVAGYDDATGWGTLNGSNLLNDLAQQSTPNQD